MPKSAPPPAKNAAPLARQAPASGKMNRGGLREPAVAEIAADGGTDWCSAHTGNFRYHTPPTPMRPPLLLRRGRESPDAGEPSGWRLETWVPLEHPRPAGPLPAKLIPKSADPKGRLRAAKLAAAEGRAPQPAATKGAKAHP
jgi:hypothetical protein